MHSLVALAADVVTNPPPQVAIMNYPSAVAVAVITVFTSVLLVIASKFDPTKGPLTISILIVLGMLATTAYCLVFTVPQDDITPGIVGGLSAGFGGVIVYWLARNSGPPPEP
jgi:NADPH-dependent curcumin reductase CurA